MKTSEVRHNQGPACDDTVALTQKFIAEAKKFYESAQPAAEGEEGEGEPAALEALPNVPDLLSEFKVFEWAGISFSEKETILLQKSLQKLAQTPGVQNLRLWGKIHGMHKDYFIVEGAHDGGEGEGAEPPADFEKHGEAGINKSSYWAANSPLDKWTLLPDLLPSDLNAAREIKVNFTGDLDHVIVTNPFFFKKEAFYLRAQIARIQHSTTLVPKQIYRF